ncbi:hypothetical protein N657DRAFT_659317 [Parathielavia appendiculata]|uniref:DUF8021 domain-containing protein n=1 Tax=Parathielavia appendiculata TaxID=2587402 RepID=A0AAN6YZY5_9PEZI|nr:hypothetical protein N657DRAFT_659317 [Parathielavia appendiculata]
MASIINIPLVMGLLSVAPHAVCGHPLASLATSCNRSALVEAADAYIAAQTVGNISLLDQVVARDWQYKENNKNRDARGGVLSKSLGTDHRRTNFDVVACATYSEVIVSDPANPYVIGTQIRHDPTDGLKLEYVLQENWDPIPEGKRDSRDVIKAAGDAHLDMWSNAAAADAVPWGMPCARPEESAYTGKGRPDDSCKTGIPSNHSQAPNTWRRYVIDESMGLVSIFCVWNHMIMAADSHESRLEGGQLRYIHTMPGCGGQRCSL